MRLLILMLALLAGCSSNKLKTVVGCQTDAECGDPAANFRCDTATGVCHCRNDSACAKGEFCNPAGFCQAKVTCYVNSDCPSGELCDSHSNVCIPQGRCTADDQCPIGKLCDRTLGICAPGCHSYGDCPVGNSCLCPAADGGRTECSCPSLDPAQRDQCTVGQCSTDACPNTEACPYGQLCAVPDGGTGLPVCHSDYSPDNRPYCDACVSTPGNTNTCGNGPNFCLLDTANGDFGGTYCGVDCGLGQACPNGLHCADVVVVRSIGCGTDTDCPSNSAACAQDADCANNGRCDRPAGSATGFCAGRCYKHEGNDRGFCTCVIDSECNQDTCQSSTRRCSISQRPCTLDGRGCEPVRCVSFHGFGGCRIGSNCAPNEGLGCADVRP
jgi:hypothetical protein